MTIGLQEQSQRIPVVLIVIDDENAWEIRIHNGPYVLDGWRIALTSLDYVAAGWRLVEGWY